jgi:para-aminobenzoate synthetase
VIRTLLVDHRDSFTQNLAHDLAAVNGSMPVIVEHDDPALTLEMLDDFDCVVLSPGPGHPANPGDFAFGMRVLKESSLPVLGICLGHQGLALAHGGEVSRAPEPVHGRVEEILHNGEGLFTGLPDPLAVVRYHSLAVTRVPDELEVAARTADGVVMGLAHETLPQWGVQFHPESICSEHGRDLLARFRDEVLAWMDSSRNERSQRSRPEPAPVVAGDGGQPQSRPGLSIDTDAHRTSGPHMVAHRLHVTRLRTELADEDVFETLFGTDNRAVWLDGNEASAAARFSIMGSGDILATADVQAGTVTLHPGDGDGTGDSDGNVATTSGTSIGTTGPADIRDTRFFDWLESDLASRKLSGGSVDGQVLDEEGLAAALPFCYRPGWAGYLGYELKAEIGSPNRHRSDLPDATLLFVTRAAVIDHHSGTVHLLQLDGSDWSASAQRTLTRAARNATGADNPAAAVGHGTARPADPIRAREGHADYVAKVRAAQELIAAGETYELCLTTRLTAVGDPDPWATYRRMRGQTAAPFGAYLRFPAMGTSPALAVLSTSPERFLQVDVHGRAVSQPIKGTRPRGATREEDDALREDLATHPKDRAENLMIADLVRHDLGMTAATGSVRVEELFGVHTFSRAHQLITTVSSRLAPGGSSVACLRECFPPGSMTGAPKHRTMELIDHLESGPRGVYSGALGWFGVDGALDTSVVIRTVVMAHGELRYGTGGAIVALSDPEDEYEETMVKAEPFTRLLGGS